MPIITSQDGTSWRRQVDRPFADIYHETAPYEDYNPYAVWTNKDNDDYAVVWRIFSADNLNGRNKFIIRLPNGENKGFSSKEDAYDSVREYLKYNYGLKTETVECCICGKDLTIKHTKDGKVFPNQYTEHKGKPAHIDCAKNKA